MIELILFFKIIAAIIAIESKNLLSAIISLGAVGFALAIIMVFLNAPDVAIVQVLVEVVLLVILIKATLNRDRSETDDKKEFFVRVFGIVAVGVFVFSIIWGLNSLPSFGSFPASLAGGNIPSNWYLREGLRHSGAANIVTAIILDFRAYDTLGEVSVFFAAILGAIVILRKKK